MPMEMMTENNAELQSDQSWINWKVDPSLFAPVPSDPNCP